MQNHNDLNFTGYLVKLLNLSMRHSSFSIIIPHEDYTSEFRCNTRNYCLNISQEMMCDCYLHNVPHSRLAEVGSRYFIVIPD